MSNQQQVQGAGGGLGKGGKAGESPNTLRSRAIRSTLMMYGQGSIAAMDQEELEKRVYFDKVPLRNQSGDRNFQNTTVAFVRGTQDQSFLQSISLPIQIEQPVNQTVRQKIGELIRYETNEDADELHLRFQATLISSEGSKIVGSSVEFTIAIIDRDGTYVTTDETGTPGATRIELVGKTQSYERVYPFILTGNPPWEIHVQRLTEDAETSTTRNDLIWASYKAIIHDRYRHPNRVLFFLQTDSEEFSGDPEVGVKWRGLEFDYPHNYDPTNRTYNGLFNGSMSGFGYTNNPAWVVYGLLTNERYGVGDRTKHIGVDPYTLYMIGKRCDEMVSDGQGGLEPRFTCNIYLDSADDAQKVIESFVSIFQGLLIYEQGKIAFHSDVDRPYTKIFCPANTLQGINNGQVVRDHFSYEGVTKEARHNAAYTSYLEKDNFHVRDSVYEELPEAIARDSLNPIDLVAFGCDSRAQARRYSLYYLLSEDNERRIVTFYLGGEGRTLKIGEIIAIADPRKMGERRGGRIVSATENSLVLDAPVKLLEGRIYTVSVLIGKWDATVDLGEVSSDEHLVTGAGFEYWVQGASLGEATVVSILSPSQIQLDKDPNLGNDASTDVVFYPNNQAIERIVSTEAGTVDTLEVLSDFPSIPVIQSTWVLSDDVITLPTFRVVQSIPTYEKGRVKEWEVKAAEFSREKFDRIDALERNVRFTRVQPQKIRPPRNVNASYDVDREVLSIAWEPPLTVTSTGFYALGIAYNRTSGTQLVGAYQPQYRDPNGNWVNLQLTTDLRVDVSVPLDDYEIRVRAFDLRGRISALSETIQIATISSPLAFPYEAGIKAII